MGQLCPWPPEGRRDEDLGTRTLLSFFHPRAGFFASFPEPLQLEINTSSAQLLSRVSLQPWGGQGTVPVSLCSSRGTAGLGSRGRGALGRALSIPTRAHQVPLPGNFYLVPTAVGGRAKGGLWGTRPRHWGAAAPVGTAGKPGRWERLSCLKSSTSPHPCILATSCILVFYPITSLPQGKLSFGRTCHQKELILPQSTWGCLKFP